MRSFLSVMLMGLCCLLSGALPGVGLLWAAPSSEVKMFDRQGDALQYARRQLQENADRVVFLMGGAPDSVYPRASKVAELLQNEGLTCSIFCSVMGNRVVLVPQYHEEIVLFRAYRDPQYAKTLSLPRRRALEKAREIVKDASARCRDEYDRALALHDSIVQRFSYKRNRADRDEIVSSALNSGYGVCEGYARTYKLLLDMAGIRNVIVYGKARGVEHCWNLVRLKGQWVHVDCTYDDPVPNRKDRVIRTHFAMSDDMIGYDHQWKRSSYPKAGDSSLYHPFLRGIRFKTVKELLLWMNARQQKGTWEVTAYVEEVKAARSASAVRRLLEEAQRDAGIHLVEHFILEDSVPGIILCQCRK